MAKVRTPPNQTIFVKPHVQALANVLEAEFGVTNFGTYLGHSPPEGPTQALDIFTPDNSNGYALQDRISSWLRENAKRFGCRYHIRRHQIWNIERADEGYREMTITGNRTADHMDHEHSTQYAWAPGPFGTSETPSPTTIFEGDDLLIVNVKPLGIFLLRGNDVQHLRHPDHVLEWVRAGVPYQDKVEMSMNVFAAYTGWDSGVVPAGIMGGLSEFPQAEAAEEQYDQLLTKVQAGIEVMKEEYYAMMLTEPTE